MKKRNQFNLVCGEKGSSLVELALVLPLFLLLLLGSVDFGRAFYLAIEIAGAARAGAMYGASNPTDTTGMATVAKNDGTNVPDLSVATPTYACECPNGTDSSATCPTDSSCSTGSPVYVVTVKVSGTYAPLIPWPGIPPSVSLSSSASMRSAGS